MGKTRDLFKKIEDIKGMFSCRDGHDKGQKWCKPERRDGEEVAGTHRRAVEETC